MRGGVLLSTPQSFPCTHPPLMSGGNRITDLLNSTVCSKRVITFAGLFVVLGSCIYFQRYVVLYSLFTFPGMFEFISMAKLKSTTMVGSFAIMSAFLYNISLAISIMQVVAKDLHRDLPNAEAENMLKSDLYTSTFYFLTFQIALLFARELSASIASTNTDIPSRRMLVLVGAGAVWCPGLTFFSALIATHTGIFFLAFLLIVTGLQDNWQLMFGKVFGRHRPFPYLSPKKSIEGYVGGTMATVVTIWYAQRYFVHDMRLSPLVVVFGIAGDLSMSAVKRSLGIKDTGGVLPGVGGLLDRMDSLILVLPAAYMLLVSS